jgi:hypothetical protein
MHHRSGLIAIAGLSAVMPVPAAAEVCDKINPDWDGARVTALAEAVTLASSLPVVLLLLATAIAIRTRSKWGGVAVVSGWSFMTYFFALGSSDVYTAARAEGCVGSPALFIAIVAALSVAVILYTAPASGPAVKPPDDND